MIEIRCPHCARRAEFDEPFQFLTAKHADRLGGEHLHRWGGWYVREKYPAVAAWRAPRGSDQVLWRGGSSTRDPGGYRLYDYGIVRCGACHRIAKHRLSWPADAYFQWKIRGKTLWAWNAAHARVLLHYAESLLRNPRQYPNGYYTSLEKLPAVLLAARNRVLVSGRIRASLVEAGLDPELPSVAAGETGAFLPGRRWPRPRHPWHLRHGARR